MPGKQSIQYKALWYELVPFTAQGCCQVDHSGSWWVTRTSFVDLDFPDCTVTTFDAGASRQKLLQTPLEEGEVKADRRREAARPLPHLRVGGGK